MTLCLDVDLIVFVMSVVLVSLCYFVWMFWVGVGGGQFALWLVFVVFACYLF